MLVIFSWLFNRQITKLKPPPNFPILRYVHVHVLIHVGRIDLLCSCVSSHHCQDQSELHVRVYEFMDLWSLYQLDDCVWSCVHILMNQCNSDKRVKDICLGLSRLFYQGAQECHSCLWREPGWGSWGVYCVHSYMYIHVWLVHDLLFLFCPYMVQTGSGGISAEFSCLTTDIHSPGNQWRDHYFSQGLLKNLMLELHQH
jgi:hypothetical protein